MNYLKGDIIKFLPEDINGVIQGEEGDHYHIKGFDGKTYFKLDSDILECVGKTYVNEVRKAASADQLDKSGAKYEDIKDWEDTKKSI